MRFKKHIVKKWNAWTEWVYPTPKSYFLKCCDCGLVHEIQFKAIIGASRSNNGKINVIELPEAIRTAFRARRITRPKVNPSD